MFLEWKISIMHAFLLVKSMWWKNKLASIKGFELKNMLSHMMCFFSLKMFRKSALLPTSFFYYKPWRIIWLLNCKNTLIVTNFLTYLFIVSSFYFCSFSVFIEKIGCIDDDDSYCLFYGSKTNHYLLLLQVRQFTQT